MNQTQRCESQIDLFEQNDSIENCYITYVEARQKNISMSVFHCLSMHLVDVKIGFATAVTRLLKGKSFIQLFIENKREKQFEFRLFSLRHASNGFADFLLSGEKTMPISSEVNSAYVPRFYPELDENVSEFFFHVAENCRSDGRYCLGKR